MTAIVHAVPVPGGLLHVVDEGLGPPVLLVHAGIVDSRAWEPLVPHLVAAGLRPVRYDLRGFGSSTTEDVEFSNRADLRAVLDALQMERAPFVGNSMGAMICIDTILESPERAIAFVSVGGGIGGFDGGATPAEMALFERAEAAEENGDGDAVAELDLQIWVDGVGQLPTRVPEPIRSAVRAMDRQLYEADRIMGKPIRLGSSANDRLGELRLPVLALVGALDTSDTHAAAVRLKDTVVGARRAVVPDVAHLIGLEAPAELAELIVDFVEPLRPWG